MWKFIFDVVIGIWLDWIVRKTPEPTWWIVFVAVVLGLLWLFLWLLWLLLRLFWLLL